MIFSLVQDFADALAAMPAEHPRRRILKLLDEAIRRDVHFIDRHPTTLFQCVWNSGSWYDDPRVQMHYSQSAEPLKEEYERWYAAPPDDPATEALIPDCLEKQKLAFFRGWVRQSHDLPWLRQGPRLHDLLQRWLQEKVLSTPDFLWVKALRPPARPLGDNLRSVLAGHTDAVSGIAVTPDNFAVISASRDGTVRKWDLKSGIQMLTLDAHGPIESLSLSRDGNRVAVVTYDGRALVWNLLTEELVVEWRYSDKLHCYNSFVSYTPDGTHLIAVAEEITRWDLKGNLVARAIHPDRWQGRVEFLDDGDTVVAFTGNMRAAMCLLDGKSLALREEIQCQYPIVDAVATRDGSQLVLRSGLPGLGSNRLIFWDRASNSFSTPISDVGRDQIAVLPGDQLLYHRGAGWFLIPLKLCPDVTKEDLHSLGRPVLKDISLGDRVDLMESMIQVESFAWTSDSHYLLSGMVDGSIAVWSLDSGQVSVYPDYLDGNSNPVTGAVPLHDGSRLLVCCITGLVQEWSVADGTLRSEQDTGGGILTCDLSSDDRSLAISKKFGIIKVWDRLLARQVWSSDDQAVERFASELKSSATVQSLAWSRDGSSLAISYGDIVLVRDGKTGMIQQAWESDHGVKSCAFNSDGKILTWASSDNSIRFCSVSSGEMLHSLSYASEFEPFPQIGLTDDAQQLVIDAAGDWHVVKFLDSFKIDKQPKRIDLQHWIRNNLRPLWNLADSKTGMEVHLEEVETAVAWLPRSIGRITCIPQPNRACWASISFRHIQFNVLMSGENPMAYYANPQDTAKRDFAISYVKPTQFQPEQGQQARVSDISAPATERHDAENIQTSSDAWKHLRNMHQRLAPSGGYSGSHPHPAANPDRAAQLNIEYQRKLADWNALPVWKRWFTKRPDRPTGI